MIYNNKITVAPQIPNVGHRPGSYAVYRLTGFALNAYSGRKRLKISGFVHRFAKLYRNLSAKGRAQLSFQTGKKRKLIGAPAEASFAPFLFQPDQNRFHFSGSLLQSYQAI